MKRIIFFLVLLCIPYFVMADSVSPSILGYDAVVINKKGAKDKYEEGKTIPYNTKIVVDNEYYYDEDVSAHVCLKSNLEDCYDIYLKDIAPLKSEIVPKDLDKKNNYGTTLEVYKYKILVSGSKGVTLKKGPAEAYGEYNIIIPQKTFLTITHAIHYEGHGGGYTWFYVNNEEYKGWINNDDDIATIIEESIMMFDDVKMYDIDTDEVIETIPIETVIDEAYVCGKIYFVYNDKLGYIEGTYQTSNNYTYEYGYKSKLGYILTTKSIELKSNGKSVTAIPKGERIKILYGMHEDDYESDAPYHITAPICINNKECLYYIEYNGQKGFIYDTNVIAIRHEDQPREISYDNDLVIYDVNYYLGKELYNEKISLEEYSKKYETDNILPAHAKATFYTELSLEDNSIDSSVNYYGNKTNTIYLIKYKNIVGWIIDKTEDNRVFDEKPTQPEPVIPEKGKDKSTRTIIISIIAAVVVSSIAVVTLFIFNKKKKKVSNQVDDKSITKKTELVVSEKKDDKKNEG